MKFFERFKSFWGNFSSKSSIFSRKQTAYPRFRINLRLVIVYVASVLIVAYDLTPRYDLPKLGDVSRVDIQAPYEIKIIDEEETEKLKREAANSVSPVYVFDPRVEEQALKSLDILFSSFEREPGSDEIKILQDFKARLENETLLILSKLDAADRKKLLGYLKRNLKKLLKEPGLREEEVEMNLDRLEDRIDRSFTEEESLVLMELFRNTLKPNRILDKAETQKKKESVVSRVVPVQQIILPGQMIIRSGDIVRKSHERIFKEMSLYEKNSSRYAGFIGAALLILFCYIIAGLFILRFSPNFINTESLVALLGWLIIGTLVFAKVSVILLESRVTVNILSNKVPAFSPYVVPIAAVVILIALLLDLKFAMISNIILSVLVSIILRVNDLKFLVTCIFAGMVALLNVRSVSQRSDLTRVGIAVSLSNVFMIAAFALLEKNLFDPNYYAFLMRDVCWGFFNGFFAAIFSIGLLPFLEGVFKVTTSMRLLELSDLNTPLMRRLLLEAPGTYHHSIIVGNLAEAAAKEIGADAVLSKVGAYYHDIGKLKRPWFFVENQTGVNQHDALKPNLSTLVIVSHIKDGIEIGAQYNLPKSILDIIQQHHGTSLLTYFFHRAVEAGERDEEVKEELFRYPGPRPQTKEAAIVLLADSIEAAARSLMKPTASSIRGLIKKITNDKFADGQLDECDITRKDLEKISNVFMKMLLHMFHARIEYPETEEKKGILRDEDLQENVSSPEDIPPEEGQQKREHVYESGGQNGRNERASRLEKPASSRLISGEDEKK